VGRCRICEPLRGVEQDKSEDRLPRKKAIEAMGAGMKQGFSRNIGNQSGSYCKSDNLNQFISPGPTLFICILTKNLKAANLHRHPGYYFYPHQQPMTTQGIFIQTMLAAKKSFISLFKLWVFVNVLLCPFSKHDPIDARYYDGNQPEVFRYRD